MVLHDIEILLKYAKTLAGSEILIHIVLYFMITKEIPDSISEIYSISHSVTDIESISLRVEW